VQVLVHAFGMVSAEILIDDTTIIPVAVGSHDEVYE